MTASLFMGTIFLPDSGGWRRADRRHPGVGGAAALLLLAAACSACAPRASAPVQPPGIGDAPALPPIPARTGELALDLVYPPEEGRLSVRDSTFVFGSTGTGAARLTINGAPVEVEPNGAFLAFLPVPADGVYRLEAQADGRSDTLEREVQLPPAPDPPETDRLHILGGTVEPRDVRVVRRGEPLTVRFRGTPGGQARLLLPDGTAVPMVERQVERAPATGFMQRERPARVVTEYVATFPAEVAFRAADTAVAAPTVVAAAGRERTAVVELVVGTDTVRAPVEATVSVLDPGETRVGVAAEEGLSGVVPGMAATPPGTPYHWLFPTGTRLPITGEGPGTYRVQLMDDLAVWVPQRSVELLPPGAPPVSGSVATVHAVSYEGWDEVRVATSQRFPFHVSAQGRSLTISIYGARSRTNWRYLPTDGSLIEDIQWQQASDGEYRLHIDLAQPLWGWLASWSDAGELTLRIRRPPAVDAAAPLRGVTVAVDAGHPPGGAIGPTRLTEAEANLAIAKRLIPMLRAAGANVIETRPDTATLGLYERVVAAVDGGAHLFVSVHNNAFGDGVNPFENAGTSVLYNRPQSLAPARHLQRALLAELGLRDLGAIGADIAVIRHNTWMPAVLTETMFLMVPRQEAALRDPGVQERIARAHVRGLESFLREVAER